MNSKLHFAAMVPVSMGLASVLYTFYPPLIGNPFYYIGVVLVVVGSWIWVALMSINMAAWKRENPDKPVPARHVRQRCGSHPLGLDRGRRGALELLFEDYSGCRWAEKTESSCAGPGRVFLDAACDRVFLAARRYHLSGILRDHFAHGNG